MLPFSFTVPSTTLPYSAKFILFLSLVAIFILNVTSIHLEHSLTFQNVCKRHGDCEIVSSLSTEDATLVLLQEDHEQALVSLRHNETEFSYGNWSGIHQKDSERILKMFYPAQQQEDARKRDSKVVAAGSNGDSWTHSNGGSEHEDKDYLYYVTNQCTIYRNSMKNPLKVPTDRLNVVLQSPSQNNTLRFIDMSINMPFAYILAEFPLPQQKDSMVFIIRVNLDDFSLKHIVQYFLGSELSTITWTSMTEHENYLYLSGNQISRYSSTNDMDWLYSGLIHRISLPAFEDEYTFQLLDQSHEMKRITPDLQRHEFLYGAVLDRSTSIPAAKIYSFDFNDTEVQSVEIDPKCSPQAKFSELVYFSQPAVKYFGVTVAMENVLFGINITFPTHPDENGAPPLGVKPNMEVEHIRLTNDSSIFHLSKMEDGRLLVVSQKGSALRVRFFTVRPEVPPSHKIRLPAWIVVVVIGSLILLEYVLIVTCIGGGSVIKKIRSYRKRKDSYDEIEDYM